MIALEAGRAITILVCVLIVWGSLKVVFGKEDFGREASASCEAMPCATHAVRIERGAR